MYCPRPSGHDNDDNMSTTTPGKMKRLKYRVAAASLTFIQKEFKVRFSKIPLPKIYQVSDCKSLAYFIIICDKFVLLFLFTRDEFRRIIYVVNYSRFFSLQINAHVQIALNITISISCPILNSAQYVLDCTI